MKPIAGLLLYLHVIDWIHIILFAPVHHRLGHECPELGDEVHMDLVISDPVGDLRPEFLHKLVLVVEVWQVDEVLSRVLKKLERLCSLNIEERFKDYIGKIPRKKRNNHGSYF